MDVLVLENLKFKIYRHEMEDNRIYAIKNRNVFFLKCNKSVKTENQNFQSDENKKINL